MFGLRNHQYWIFVNIKVSSLKIFYHMAAQRYSPIVLGRALTTNLVNKADEVCGSAGIYPWSKEDFCSMLSDLISTELEEGVWKGVKLR